mgnify:CR=1 FL=1
MGWSEGGAQRGLGGAGKCCVSESSRIPRTQSAGDSVTPPSRARLALLCGPVPPQARHSYAAADIRMNERFVPIELRLRRGQLGLDFSGFDATTAKALAAGGADQVRDEG